MGQVITIRLLLRPTPAPFMLPVRWDMQTVWRVARKGLLMPPYLLLCNFKPLQRTAPWVLLAQSWSSRYLGILDAGGRERLAIAQATGGALEVLLPGADIADPWAPMADPENLVATRLTFGRFGVRETVEAATQETAV